MSRLAKSPVVVVCPTEYGGHIEHAADLAMALARREDVGQCLLVSRPGAAAYLGGLEHPGLRIAEILPPRRLPARGPAGRLRPLLQVFDLAVEHARLRALAGKLGPAATVLFETPKYPFPSLAVGPHATTVLFMHNAKPHVDEEHAGTRERILAWLERRTVHRVDRLVTHGQTQLETLAGFTGTPAAAVPLPTSSALDLAGHPQPANTSPGEPYALCIGELRPNKGIELAIGAAAASGVQLLVAGKSDSPALARELAGLAAQSPNVSLRDEFLSAPDFDALIRGAGLVVLPYTHFDAQSGILSKAMGAGLPVLAADLPALRDQAAGYQAISYTDIHEPGTFARDLVRSFALGSTTTSGTQGAREETGDQWDAVAAAVLNDPAPARHAAR